MSSRAANRRRRAGEIIKTSSSWAELHSKLAEHGARFETKGSGAVILIDDIAVGIGGRECGLAALKSALVTSTRRCRR